MELWTIIFGLFVLLLVTLYRVEVDGNCYMGTRTVGNVTCNFAEYKCNGGRGPRGLRHFSCRNESSKLNVDCIYYGGNPHNCKKYKPDQQNSIKKYYRTLATAAMDNGNPCRPENITENICKEYYPCYNRSCMSEHL